MTAFHADLAELEQLVGRLAAFDERADALVAELESAVRRVHGQWTGGAADAHLAAHRRWSVGAQHMRTAVEQLRTLVSTARANYSAAAAANTGMWA